MKLLYEGFVYSVKDHPDSEAIVYDGESWTYRELMNHVNGIRRKMQEHDWGKGIVAVMGEKSGLSIAAILAILLEGSAYLPIDINYPSERVKYIISNSHVKHLLFTDERWNKELECIKEEAECIQISNKDISETKMQNQGAPDELAYVIYTSGSTGKPNGVMIQNKAICNTINWRMKYYRMDYNTRVLQFASLSFDSSVEDIFSTLSSGGTLVIPKEKNKLNLSYLEETIVQNKISHLLMIPSLYSLLLKHKKKEWQTVREVVLAGESVGEQLVKTHFTLNSQIRLFNEYGPTENSVCSTVSELHKDKPVTIGKPIDGVKAFIMDESLCKISNSGNRVGCLYLGGHGLALGYINNEVATRQKFIETEADGRIYCTGDMVTINEDGKYCFLGRNDGEVKINGIRINLAELENSIIESFEDVDECICCLTRYNSVSKIVLCVHESVRNNETEIINYIKDNMSKQMIPNYIYYRETFPKLPNYKVDRAKLIMEIEGIYHMEDLKEEIIKKVHEILKKYIPDNLKNDTDFIEAGIDSLSLVGILTDLEDEFNTEFDLMDKNLDGNFTVDYIANKIVNERRESIVQVR